MRKLYLFVIVAVLSLQVSAQTLRFNSTLYNFGAIGVDSTSQTLVIRDSLYNTSTQFTGSVLYNATINSGNAFVLDSAFFTLIDSGTTPNTAVPATITVPLSNPAFTSGPNTLVIWPLYHGRTGPDSIHVYVTLTHLAGLDDAPLAKMYLTQQGQMLNIHFGDYQDIIEQVSLYNIEGRLMFSGTTDRARNISTANWSSGLYFCEIKTYKGERRTIKFILQ